MLEAIQIEVWADYVCPWCFLTAHHLQQFVLQQSSTEYPVALRWRAFELRPKDGPPTPAEHLAKVQAKRPQVYAMMRQKYDLHVNPGPFGIDSRPAHIATKVAESQGLGPAYHTAIMRAYWQGAQNIAEEAVLAEIAGTVGLEPSLFAEALQQPNFRQAALDDIDYAQRNGFRTVPSLVFAGKYAVSGAQSPAALRKILQQVYAKERAIA